MAVSEITTEEFIKLQHMRDAAEKNGTDVALVYVRSAGGFVVLGGSFYESAFEVDQYSDPPFLPKTHIPTATGS